ncbi:MAG: prolipoprotein diacylglyceryl transferase [Candidatus Moranbacteria bacterium]|nr:prolipoprotein diacylglyceryl transferase [Candidatus Moranbacteria bacterium]
MKSITLLYQNLPRHINPMAFSIGPFPVAWYSLMYLVAFATVYFLLRWRIKKKESDFSPDTITNFLFYNVAGVVLGGRLGYVLFYDLAYYLRHPLEIISPFNSAGDFIGIYGMSYHGGLLGVLIASFIFVKKRKINFRKLADFVVPAVPAGYFFGRIGNFFNLEIYGKATTKIWGMYFSADFFWELRHPTQLYEAFLEGILLFAILWPLRNNKYLRGNLFPLYLIGYGLVRFPIEFLRDTSVLKGMQFDFIDVPITLSQIFCLAMVFAGAFLFLYNKKTS